jgi:hypothetical protein
VGEEPNHTTARKPGPLGIIQYSLLDPGKVLKQFRVIILPKLKDLLEGPL